MKTSLHKSAVVVVVVEAVAWAGGGQAACWGSSRTKSHEWSGWLWTTVEGQGLNRQLGGHGRAPTTSSDQGPVRAGASRTERSGASFQVSETQRATTEEASHSLLSLGLLKGMTSSTHRRSGATHCSEVSGGASGKRLARDRPPMPEAGTVDHLPPET